jgi:ubiquinone biosynthesis protein
MPIVETAARTALGARQVVKDLGRLQEIVQVLARHGLGWVVANIEVPGIGLLRKVTGESERRDPTPERVTDAMRDLGPTFVKLGQVLSTRGDLLPEEYTTALAKLQDDVGPVPYEAIVAQIEAALGAPPERMFKTFNREPLATASIAQVHRATLPTGEDVAVKVQRPGIRSTIATDLSILQFLARQVEAQLPAFASMDPIGVVRVFRRSISEETDFRVEASNMDRFQENFSESSVVIIPEVFRTFSTQDVLTLQFLDGVKISRAREAGCDMRLVGRRYLGSSFQMLLEDGYFHGDLHPGNVLVLPGNRLGLLDFGMVGRLTQEMRENLVGMFFAINRRDFRTMARIYWELAIKPETLDYAAWETDVQELMERQFVGKSMADIHVADFLQDVMTRANRHNVRMTPTYTMFFKALVTTEGLAKMLIPEVDPLQEMMPYVQRMARAQYSKDRLQEELVYFLTSFRFSIRRLPMIVGRLSSDLQEGKLRARVIAEMTTEDRLRQEGQTNRVTLALVFCGLVVGSSLALDSTATPLLGMPFPATVGYLLALAVGTLVLRSLLGSRN